MKHKVHRATLQNVLIYYDQPQLLLLRTDRDFPMVAVAVEHVSMTHPFYGCEVRDKTLSKYTQQKADLHYLFSQAVSHRYYFFDLSDLDGDAVTLAGPEPATEEAKARYWPSPGIFARSHTSSPQATNGVARRSFKIDGKWGASDFSRFHGKLSDLYAFYSALDRFEDDSNGTERHEIANLIVSRFWQGGGSYGGFYDDLEQRVTSLARKPLEVDAIQYNSPGEIIFRGDGPVLSEVASVIELLESESDKLKEASKKVYSTLKKEGLLSAKPNAKFSSSAVRKFVRKTTHSLADMLNIQSKEDLYEACGRRTLVYAKVVLSIYRRAKDLHSFYEEGRVSN